MRAILLREEQIKSLICQREPVILIDTFFKPADPEYYTGLKILPGNIFCREGIFSAEGVIEHMAQSSAAMLGYLAAGRNEQVKTSYIGEIRDFELVDNPRAGDFLETIIEILSEVMDVILVRAESYVVSEPVVSEAVVSKPIASCKMKLAIN
ncbi:hydroxymyristoyl-ACP dehydratase [Proteiniphilum sp.]|uniref:hydroxymyristoyl-ACP dehydratase n=1 Tax=Proteiniphilum sp. TaxID=1926877 RepID=UPI00332C1129